MRDGLRSLFEKYGLPKALRVDNGGPWGRLQNTPKWLALWIAGLGVDVRWIRPSTPKDNPQIERCNRLVDEWSEPHTCKSVEEWQTRLDQMVELQREEYPVRNGLPRTTIHPEFKEVKRPYSRETEMDSWDLSQAKRLLSQFSWQRVVSSKGQITVMSQRFMVGSTYRGRKVNVRFDAEQNVYAVKDMDGKPLCTADAVDINVETIMSLASTHQKRRRQTCGATP